MSATAAAENNSPVTNNAEQAGPNEPKTEADAGVKQCRICLAGAEEEATCGRLIKPCLCRGSMQYVHVKCLNEWRKVSNASSAFYQCGTCHYSYAFARTKVSGMATSPLVLGLASALLLTIIAFVSSFVVVYFFPTLATPTYSLKSGNIRGFLVSPLSVANAVLGKSLRAYDTITWSWWWPWGYNDDDYVDDIIAEPAPVEQMDMKDVGIGEWLVHRLLLGLSAVGSFSFLTFLYQMSLFGILRLRRFNTGRRGNRRETIGNAAAILIIIFVIIGIGKAVRDLYRFNRKMAQRMLIRLEEVILEVN